MPVLILGGGLVVFLALGLPVGFALLATSVAMITYSGSVTFVVIAHRLQNSLDSFPLLAIPLFILAADLMNRSGVTTRIFRFAGALVGHITGGLAHVNILASILFSGMSGSAVADASSLGMIEIKAMVDEGYKRPFAGAVTAASSTIGPIIPPSVPMVIFGVISGTSIGALFMGGIVPGLIMGLALMVLVYVIARRSGDMPRRSRVTALELARAFLAAAPALLLPIIILGGIWGGIFSPTEAAGVAVVYSLALGMFAYKEIPLRHLPRVFVESARTTASIMFIVAAAGLYGWLVSIEGIPRMIQGGLLAITAEPLIILLIVNVILLILGMFMELIAILIISVPVFLPVLTGVGFDPVYLGVVMVLNLMIGFLTPPFGLNVFIMQKLARCGFRELIGELWPFMAVLVGTLLLVIFIPELVTALPEYIYGF